MSIARKTPTFYSQRIAELERQLTLLGTPPPAPGPPTPPPYYTVNPSPRTPVHDWAWGGSTTLANDDGHFQVLQLNGKSAGLPDGSTGYSQPVELYNPGGGVTPEMRCTVPRGFDPRRAFGARSETRWSAGTPPFMLGTSYTGPVSGYVPTVDGYETDLLYEMYLDGTWPYLDAVIDGSTRRPWTVLGGQWHQWDDTASVPAGSMTGAGTSPTGTYEHDSATSPPISMEMIHGTTTHRIRIRSAYWEDPSRNKGEVDHGGGSTPAGAVWFSWAAVQGAWVSMRMRIVHASSDGVGKMRVYANGVDLGTKLGKTMDVFTGGPYAGTGLPSFLQFGIYRWSQDGDRQASPAPNQWNYLPTSTVRYRNIRYRTWDQNGSGDTW